jgi:hypothetical protein
VRGETTQIIIGVAGLVLASIGVYIGFEIGKKKK